MKAIKLKIINVSTAMLASLLLYSANSASTLMCNKYNVYQAPHLRLASKQC